MRSTDSGALMGPFVTAARRWVPASVWRVTGIRLPGGGGGDDGANGDYDDWNEYLEDDFELDDDYEYDDEVEGYHNGSGRENDDELSPLHQQQGMAASFDSASTTAMSPTSPTSTSGARRRESSGSASAGVGVGAIITNGNRFNVSMDRNDRPLRARAGRRRRTRRSHQAAASNPGLIFGRGSWLGRQIGRVFGRRTSPPLDAPLSTSSSTSPRRKTVSSLLARLIAFALAHPFIAFALFILILRVLRPFWFYFTHWTWGFVVYPFPSAHHGFGWLMRNPATRPWMLAWDGTRPVRPWREGEPFPPPLPPFSLLPWRHSFNSKWNDFAEFPMPKIVQAPSMYEWEVPKLTKPKRRPRRRLGESIKPVGRGVTMERSIWREAYRANATLASLIVEDHVNDAEAPALESRHQHHPPPPDHHHHQHDTCNPHAYWSDPRDLTSPAMLAIHAFSTARPKDRPMRDVLREHQRRRVPWEYMHLLDFQFVICSPPASDTEAWSRLSAEQEEWGDLLLLDELATNDADRMKENGDDGKTYRWMREVVSRALDGRGREALWVMKTDIDSYHILSNLLDWIVDNLPPMEPSFFGSSFGTSWQNKHYFQGLGYGFSWSVLRTLVAADLALEQTLKYEDHRTGSYMFSLPAKPGAKAPRFVPETIEAWSPPTPDAHTGLIRADMFELAGSWYYWWLPQSARTIIAHGMKNKKVNRLRKLESRDLRLMLA